MGCYDTVMVPCPACQTKVECQSKGGDCLCRVFELNDAPIDVLSDINRHIPHECPECKTKFIVDLTLSESTCPTCNQSVTRVLSLKPVLWEMKKENCHDDDCCSDYGGNV